MNEKKKRVLTWDERDLLWQGGAFLLVLALFAGVLLLFPVSKLIFKAVVMALTIAGTLIMLQLFDCWREHESS